MSNIIQFPKVTLPKKNYLKGVFWAIMICVVGVVNDILMRFLGDRLHFVEISFFRFFFGMLTILPVMFANSVDKTYFFKTQALGAHIIRGVIGTVAIALCCYSVNIMPLSENTAIMFAQPLFFLPLASIFLKERIGKERAIATLIGFLGLIYVIHPGKDILRIEAFVPITAAILFAISDIYNKKMVAGEHSYTLIFYFSFVTTLISAFFLPSVWSVPSFNELFLLLLLGAGANLIQFCIFKAFAVADASALMPFRYVEFPMSALAGYLMFDQIPPIYLIFGAFIIGGSSFYITYLETNNEKKEREEKTVKITYSK